MIKRSHLICILLLSLTPLSSFAAGFYVGAGLGPDYASFKVDARIKEIHNGRASFDVKNGEQLAGTGAFGTIFAGYGRRLSDWGFKPNNYYLGGELNANLSTLQHQNFNNEFVHMSFSSTNYRMRYGFGASILPGYLFTDATLFYGRVGYANANFKVSTSDASLKDIDRNLSGFRWGFGLQQALATRIAMRVEYSNTLYSSTSISTFDRLSTVSKTVQFAPNENEVEFGIVYNFC